MNLPEIIHGFSTLNREEKIRIAASYTSDPAFFSRMMHLFWEADPEIRNPVPEISENVLSAFCLPYSIAPNFLINNRHYMVPMVTEESSVVAAASSAAKYWWTRGGFHCHVSQRLKPGNIHFIWKGPVQKIREFIHDIHSGLRERVKDFEQSMQNRGGGIREIKLHDLTESLKGYYRLEVLFDTVDAMGANFINTCLEVMAQYIQEQAIGKGISEDLEIIMSILSNFTPECLVQCNVSCPVKSLDDGSLGIKGADFARRFSTAIDMAAVDISRAVTNNKGIFNGIDAVLIATGNDFRAVEASGHAWAARNGGYKGLSKTEISSKEFSLSMEIPLSLGVIGGLTTIHPMAKASLALLGKPDARILMMVAASAGLANHFSAIRALITRGIQKGHMKMHLSNLLNQAGANEREKERATEYFKDKTINIVAVRDFISIQRK